MINLKQIWPDHIKYIIIEPHSNASCQLYIYNEEQNFGGRAYIQGLYVPEESRNEGIGSAILKEAERIAKDSCCDVVTLDYDNKNSDPIALSMYLKREYNVTYALLKKDLNGHSKIH